MLATRWATQYPERTDHLVLVNPIGLEDYRRTLPYLGVEAWQAQAAGQSPDRHGGPRGSHFCRQVREAWSPPGLPQNAALADVVRQAEMPACRTRHDRRVRPSHM